MDVERPVGHARVDAAHGVQDDRDNTGADHGEEEVPHATSGGVGILTIAVEEHRSAIEEAGGQAEGIADALLRELGRRRHQVEVDEETGLVEADQVIAEQHTDEHRRQANPLQNRHRFLAEDTCEQHADDGADIDE